jgi:putative Holliday junction resolvase
VRVVGLDLGSRRIGVAVSDPTGTIASPYEVVPRDEKLHQKLLAVVEEVGAERVVVGLPLSLSGQDGPAAASARAEAAQLAEALPVPVELYDERLTTVSATRSMVEVRMKADARKRVVDKVAAAVMLQSWLDGPGRATVTQR